MTCFLLSLGERPFLTIVMLWEMSESGKKDDALCWIGANVNASVAHTLMSANVVPVLTQMQSYVFFCQRWFVF